MTNEWVGRLLSGAAYSILKPILGVGMATDISNNIFDKFNKKESDMLSDKQLREYLIRESAWMQNILFGMLHDAMSVVVPEALKDEESLEAWSKDPDAQSRAKNMLLKASRLRESEVRYLASAFRERLSQGIEAAPEYWIRAACEGLKQDPEGARERWTRIIHDYALFEEVVESTMEGLGRLEREVQESFPFMREEPTQPNPFMPRDC